MNIRGKLASRWNGNPIISSKDIPYESSLIFNAGVCKYQGEYIMLFRNDFGASESEWRKADADGADYPSFETNIGIARSRDGIHWEPGPKPVFELSDNDILRAYDPRLTVIEGKVVMCFAVDTRHGLRGGIAVTEDFDKFEIRSLTLPDNRNMVLFPEKIGGKFLRLERPLPVYSHGGGEKFDIWISNSPDLVYWGEHSLLVEAEQIPFANTKIGPGAPPVKTSRGWLTTFHAVRTLGHDLPAWHSNWRKEYNAGILLLDLNNPTKVLGIYNQPLLSAQESYELNGYRGSVIFPGGMILEDSGEVKIYYGAADTVECLATANADDLIDAILYQKH